MSGKYCYVYGCDSRPPKISLDIHFFLFPKKGKGTVKLENANGTHETIDRRTAWIKKLQMDEHVTDFMTVCSLHFVESDYLPGQMKSRVILKKIAVPSKNLPQRQFDKLTSSATFAKQQPMEVDDTSSNSDPEHSDICEIKNAATLIYTKEEESVANTLLSLLDSEPIQSSKVPKTANNKPTSSTASANQQTLEQTLSLPMEVDDTSSNSDPEHSDICENICEIKNAPTLTYTKEEESDANTLLSLLDSEPIQSSKVPKTMKDFEGQVNMFNISTICDLIKTEDALKSFTGLQSFAILNFIERTVNKFYKDVRLHKVKIRSRIILCFIKLKTDLPFSIIRILFNISSQLCITYFTDMIDILSQVLKPLIRFPALQEIKMNVPEHFKDFSDTQIVLDCTEISMQTPKCLCCRLRFYSHYKSGQTIKFMTGVAPAGIITYISSAYGGRASDKHIFEESGLITKMEEGSAIMVDKGFLIDTVCHNNNIKLYRPPFLRNKGQLSVEEAIFNKKIAAARVHIERTYQRIKLFKILSGKLQWSLVRSIDKIFLIACAVTNMSSPILSNNKFVK